MASEEARQSRQLRWFQHGVHALACVVSPRPPEAYVCPLCLNFFTREDLDAGVLTDEHVPPKAVGGQALVLTCRSCNNASSGRLDKEVVNAEKRRTFGTPHALGLLQASVTIDGNRSTGSLRFDGETFVMHSEAAQNNPATLTAYTAALEGLEGGSALEVRLPIKVNVRRIALGWMRSAYLGAFAVYGYRYVLQPAFEPLRAAIADPDNSAFDPIVHQVPAEGPLDPLIGEVAAPASVAGCQAAVLGTRLILLPPWLAPPDWFATLRTRLANDEGESIALASVIGQRFPDHPMHLTDG